MASEYCPNAGEQCTPLADFIDTAWLFDNVSASKFSGFAIDMLMDVAALGRASDEILNAAVEPERWASVIKNLGEAGGAFAVNIMEPLDRGALGGVLITDNLDNVWDAYMREEWYLRDFRAQFIPLFLRAGVVVDRNYATDEQMRTLDYYKFLEQFRMKHTAVISFSVGDNPLFLVLQRYAEQGPFLQEEQALLHGVRQKLLTAGSIMTHMSTAKVNGMLSAFELANVATLFFNRRGAVTFVNAKAQAMIGNGIEISRGELRARWPQETALFHKQLQNVLQSKEGGPAGGSSVVLLSRLGKRPLVVRLQRLHGHIAEAFSAASVLALIEDVDENTPNSPAGLRELFQFTPAEIEIALLLAQGLSAREIAEQRAITYETARTHIRSIYRKTDTGRHAELTALLSRLRA
ncbi:LuxR C-terminal-related transcriptional regulator [Rhizobium herbae]